MQPDPTLPSEEELRELERLIRDYVKALEASRSSRRDAPTLLDAGIPLVQALDRLGGEHAVMLSLIAAARQLSAVAEVFARRHEFDFWPLFSRALEAALTSAGSEPKGPHDRQGTGPTERRGDGSARLREEEMSAPEAVLVVQHESDRAAIESRLDAALAQHAARELSEIEPLAGSEPLECDGCGYTKARCDAIKPPAIKCCPDCKHEPKRAGGESEPTEEGRCCFTCGDRLMTVWFAPEFCDEQCATDYDSSNNEPATEEPRPYPFTDRAIRALYDIRAELTHARRAGAISTTQAVELTGIEAAIDALEATERRMLATEEPAPKQGEAGPIAGLADLLDQAGARVMFDRGRDITKPCTFCGKAPETTHDLRRIGTYPNGTALTRPVCAGCKRVGDAIEEAFSNAPAGVPVERVEAAIKTAERISSCKYPGLCADCKADLKGLASTLRLAAKPDAGGGG